MFYRLQSRHKGFHSSLITETESFVEETFDFFLQGPGFVGVVSIAAFLDLVLQLSTDAAAIHRLQQASSDKSHSFASLVCASQAEPERLRAGWPRRWQIRVAAAASFSGEISCDQRKARAIDRRSSVARLPPAPGA